MWERFSFYGMRALLVIYLTQHFLFSDGDAQGLYAAYAALVYLIPVIGGVIADRFLGARKAVTIGAALLVLGHFGMAFEGSGSKQYLENAGQSYLVTSEGRRDEQQLFIDLPEGRANMRFANSTHVDLSGNGQTRAFVTLGTGIDGSPWPLRSDCAFWSTAEIWASLPGTMNAQGDYDGSLNLPQLPPGFRLWCQAGAIDLGTVGMSFSDAVTLVTPPAGPLPIPAVRIVNSTNQASATGTISNVVPVMGFF